MKKQQREETGGWISVEDSLPKNSQDVLLFFGKSKLLTALYTAKKKVQNIGAKHL